MNRNTARRSGRSAWMIATAILAGQAGSVLAQTHNWSGAAGSSWSNASNWTGAGLPVSGATTELLFGAVLNASSVNDLSDPFTLRLIRFSGTRAVSMTIGGNALQFATGAMIEQATIRNQILNPNLLLADNLNIIGTGTGSLTLGGAIGGDFGIVKGGGFGLVLGSESSTFTGPITINAGRVIAPGANTLSGKVVVVNVNDGLQMLHTSPMVGGLGGSGNVSIAAGQQLTLGAGDRSATYNGVITSASAMPIFKIGSGTQTFTAPASYTGAMHIRHGEVRVNAGASIGSTTSEMIVGDDDDILTNFTGLPSTLRLNGAGASVTASSFAVRQRGVLVLENGATISGPGPRPQINLHGALNGRFVADVVLNADFQGVLTLDGGSDLNLSGTNALSELVIRPGTTTINGNFVTSPSVLEMRATRNGSNITGLPILDIPSGIAVRRSSIAGSGLIRGPITYIDTTPGASTFGRAYLPKVSVGASDMLAVDVNPVTPTFRIDGGTYRTTSNGAAIYIGSLIEGCGVVEASFLNNSQSIANQYGIAFNGPVAVNLTGDLSLNAQSITSVVRNATFNVGSHQLNINGNTVLNNARFNLQGGRARIANGPLSSYTTQLAEGFGIIDVETPATGQPTPFSPLAFTATGPLAPVSNVSVPAGRFVRIGSTAPVVISNLSIAGGTLHASSGVTLNSPSTTSMFGAIDGPVTGTLSAATGAVTEYRLPIHSTELNILSTVPTLFSPNVTNAGNISAFSPSVGPAGATVRAPGGIVIENISAGGPITVISPSVTLGGAAVVPPNNPSLGFNLINTSLSVVGNTTFRSTAAALQTPIMINGSADFGSATVNSSAGIQITGPATFNNGRLINIDNWSFGLPLTGNGILSYTTAMPSNLVISPAGTPTSPQFSDQPSGKFLVVSDQPVTIGSQVNTTSPEPRWEISGTTPLNFVGSLFNVHGVFRGRLNFGFLGVSGEGGIDIGDETLVDAVQITTINVPTSLIARSATPVQLLNLEMFVGTTAEFAGGLDLGGTITISQGSRDPALPAVLRGAVVGGSTSQVAWTGAVANTTVDSLDVATSHLPDAHITFNGLPGNQPALLPRAVTFNHTQIHAPNGVWFRPGDTAIVSNAPTFLGDVLFDATMTSTSTQPTTFNSLLTGTGTIHSPIQLVGSGAKLNPGRVGSVGTLSVHNLSMIAAPGENDIGAITFEIGPAGADQLITTGNVSLDGTLSLLTLAGFVPSIDSGYTLIRATADGSISGWFDNITGVQVNSTTSFAILLDPAGDLLAHVARPGDINLDGSINFSDLLTLAQNYNSVTSSTWSTGDLTGDGAVNFGDLLILAQNYGLASANFSADWSLARSLVPEPATLALLGSVGALMLRRRH